MVGYDDDNNALTLGDDDALSVGDYDLEYNSTDDQWQARYDRPIGGEAGTHGEIGGPSYNPNGQVGDNAISFNGPPDKIPLNASTYDPNVDFTIAGWINPDSEGVQEVIFGSEASSGYHFFNNRNDTNGLSYQYNIGSGGTIISGGDSTFVSASQGWAHVAVTRSGDTWTLYIDGASVGSATDSVSTISTDLHLIGADFSNADNRFDGDMDDVRVYTRALSSSEITDLSNGVDVTGSLSGRWDFEYPETPRVAIDSTGDVFPKNSVPRSTSDSLVPQGLAESVSAGEALADDGNTYTSVQTAVDNASGWVFVGPGTFNESVGIPTSGLTLEGCGYDTLIDGGTTGHAIDIQGASDVTVRNLSAQTTAGGGTSYSPIIIGDNTQSNLTVENIYIRESDASGIDISSSDSTIRNCTVENCDGNGIEANNVNIIISGNTLTNANSIFAANSGDDCVVANNILQSSKSINVGGNDNVIIGNRVIGSSDDGILIGGTDCIIANNRISDSTNEDIDNNGTGTVLDDNLTGASN